MSKKKAKKKIAKKWAAKKATPVAAGARDVGYRKRKLAESAVATEDAPPVCAATDCYAEVPDYGDRCAKHAPSEPHVVSAPATDEEILASDNAVLREAHTKLSVPAPGHGSEDTDPSPSGDARHLPGAFSEHRPPEKHTYVPPEPAPRPALPALHRQLEFHTPPGRRGMYCDVAFALLPEAGIVVRRVLDRLAGTAAYAIAGVGDLDDAQYMEIGSHYWHDATEEDRAAIAVREFEADLRRIAEQAGPTAEAYAEKLLAEASS